MASDRTVDGSLAPSVLCSTIVGRLDSAAMAARENSDANRDDAFVRASALLAIS